MIEMIYVKIIKNLQRKLSISLEIKADWVMIRLSIKRFKYITFDKLGVENLNKFVQSKGNTRFLIEILTSYQ